MRMMGDLLDEHAPVGDEHAPVGDEHAPVGDEHAPVGDEQHLHPHHTSHNRTREHLNQALFSAAADDNVQLCELVLDHGADVRAREPAGQEELGEQVQGSMLEELTGPAKYPPVGGTALHVAAYKGSRGCAALLLDRGAALNTRDCYGRTPLMLACQSRDCSDDVITMMLTSPAGCDVTASDDAHARSALHYAAAAGRHSILSYFTDAGENIDVIDDNHQTPLLFAMSCDWCDDDVTSLLRTVRVLMTLGCDLHCTDKHGEDAVMKAVKRDSVPLLEAIMHDHTVTGSADVLMYLCTVTQNCDMLQRLLNRSCPEKQHLLTLLLRVICLDPSPWSPELHAEVKNNHQVFEVLMKHADRFAENTTDICALAEKLDKTHDVAICQRYGIIALALAHGKLSIAMVLHEAGFVDKGFARALNSNWLTKISLDKTARDWIESVKRNSPKRQEGTCDVKPYNVHIERFTSKMFDNAYAYREKSKAAVSKINAIYD